MRGVRLFAAVGPDHGGSVEVKVDEIMVCDGFDPKRSRPTTSHETLVDALNFIEAMSGVRRFYEVWL